MEEYPGLLISRLISKQMPPESSVETYLGLGQDVSHLADPGEQVAMDQADQEDRQDPEDPGEQVAMDQADQEDRQDPEDPGARGAMDQGHQVDLQMDQYQ